MIGFKILKILFLLSLASCSLLEKEETQVYERHKIPQWQLDQINKLNSEVIIDENTVILDVRKPFTYSLAHLEKAININYEDFITKEKYKRGFLDPRFYFHARRLSRYGIDLETKVLILGDGLASRGEEVWLAWYLKYLGVEDVNYSMETCIQAKRSDKLPAPVSSKKTWKPRLKDNWLITEKDLLKIFRMEKFQKESYVVVDVRSDKEYLQEDTSVWSNKGMKVIHISWNEFFNDDFTPKKEIFTRLVKVGLHPRKKLIVVSNEGVRSAAVSFVLRQFGFVEAGNFSPGYSYLNSKYWK